MTSDNRVLQVENLTVRYKNRKRITTLVDDLSFHVDRGECLGILGESGSGKSMSSKAIMGILPPRQFDVTGSARFHTGSEEPTDLLRIKKEERRAVRGRKITMILQNPMACFDPLFPMGTQMAETVRENTETPVKEIRGLCQQVLKDMQIRSPEEVLLKYPHQLSGGMLQRIMIGLALVTKPDLIIADEPTTAIDSITQFEIIGELLKIKEQGTAMIFISHDLGVVNRMANRVIVMHRAKSLQQGTLAEIIQNPGDEYTRQLVNSRLTLVDQFNSFLREPGVSA